MALDLALQNIFPSADITFAENDLEKYGQDWTRFHKPDPTGIVFPRNCQQIQELVCLARSEKCGLVPSGGRTGMSGGACATNREIVVSFEKMNAIKEFDPDDATTTLEAGVITANLHTFANGKGLYYPVDFSSSGSSQIGGNIATNAGGIRVIRYGTTRDWVAGLKVITGKGELLKLNNGLVKNNTGYDLRHLFIGSEGTLGFIVEATMKLTDEPYDASVIILAIPKMSDCLSVLEIFRQNLVMNAFEFFSENALEKVISATGMERPINNSSPYYILLEFEQSTAAAYEFAEAAFARCLSKGLALDGIISRSGSQNLKLWLYRERISEAITHRTPYKNDISVRPGKVPNFLEAVDETTARYFPEFEIVWFGHIGDGNLHLNILRPEAWQLSVFKAACDELNHHILDVVQKFEGSVSAEHGIGLLKKDFLPYSRSNSEIKILRGLKDVFDPDGIMNPGKLL